MRYILEVDSAGLGDDALAGGGAIVCKRQWQNDSQISDMTWVVGFFTRMGKIRDEADLGGKIKSSDPDVSSVRGLRGL